MSERADCKWCGFSYADYQQGREYLYHDEPICEVKWLRDTNARLRGVITSVVSKMSIVKGVEMTYVGCNYTIADVSKELTAALLVQGADKTVE